jgi:hypothetical protein
MVVKAAAAVTATVVAAAKTAVEGVAATLAPSAMATTGAGNGKGRQQSIKKWHKWWLQQQ